MRYSISSLSVPDSVLSIGTFTFGACRIVTNLTIPPQLTNIPDWAFYQCGSPTNLVIPAGVTNIGQKAFSFRPSLTSVVLPVSLTNISSYVFEQCQNLQAVYVPSLPPALGQEVFEGDTQATVYYLPGTPGWGSSYGGCPTARWVLPYPIIINTPKFGVHTNRFGFVVSWASNVAVTVEASSSLADISWTPISNTTITNGSFYFNDSDWTNYPVRFYRIRSP